MTGKLQEHLLAELIREIMSEKLSGLLRLERERIKTAVYFDKGALVYATSNLRQHRLGETLRRWRIITDKQFAALPEEGKSDVETARVLVEQGTLPTDALNDLRARLVADVLRPALLWTTGSWDFNPRVRLAEDVSVQIELPELLMEAARRLPAKVAAGRFPNTNEKVSPLTDNQTRLDLLPLEAFVLSRIDTRLRLHELLAFSGLPAEETLHACYVLSLGNFIERDAWPRAFNQDEIKRALAAGEAAVQSAQAAQAAPEPKKTEQSKPVELDERRELEDLFERVANATNHYQVLGVARSVDQEALKQTYHRLARRYHPDRYHQDETLRSRVEELFTRIAQAYEALRDRTSRAAYDLKMDREKDQRPAAPERPEPSRPATQPAQPRSSAPPAGQQPTQSGRPRAEDSFQRGLSALKTGNLGLAISSFAEAARLEPKTARYRAQYGEALAGHEQMRHRAEAELQAALLLEPQNISYRIMLAKLYLQLGFIKRAQGELERARAIDPRNTEVQEMLAALQSKQGAV